MRVPMLLGALLSGLLVVQSAALAHHGRGNRYELDKEIAIHGTVRELVWRNPHIAIAIDVPGEDGKAVTWVIEHSNVNTLARQGYHRNSLKPGQPVTAYIYPGRNGEPTGLCRRIVLEDGTVIFERTTEVD